MAVVSIGTSSKCKLALEYLTHGEGKKRRKKKKKERKQDFDVNMLTPSVKALPLVMLCSQMVV